MLIRARIARVDTPYVNQLLNGSAGGCMVQHSPYAGDGGAEETAYGWQCLEYFLTAADGGSVLPDLDLVYFNWGLHNLVAPGGHVVPGQSGYTTDYLPFLTKSHPSFQEKMTMFKEQKVRSGVRANGVRSEATKRCEYCAFSTRSGEE